jgi:hypothetical protein
MISRIRFHFVSFHLISFDFVEETNNIIDTYYSK